MTTPRGDAGNISLGAGTLYVGDLGVTLPEDLGETLDVDLKKVGYTEDGSTFNYNLTSEPVPVAEELDPVMHKTTGREGSVAFAMAENTIRNLTLAFNGGVVTRTASGAVRYAPPAPGAEKRRSLVFVSEDLQEIWVFPQVFQGGQVSLARKKGADKTTIGVEFSLEKPADGNDPFYCIYDDERDGGSGVAPVAP